MLYGPAGNMFIHAPTLCYPSAGFTTLEGPEVKAVPVAAPAAPGAPATLPFQAAVYSKGEGTRAEIQEVYWIWRYNGQWSPQVLKPKQIERVPSMIKVHTARLVLRGERRDANNPNEALLRVLMPEIERLLPSRPSPTT